MNVPIADEAISIFTSGFQVAALICSTIRW